MYGGGGKTEKNNTGTSFAMNNANFAGIKQLEQHNMKTLETATSGRCNRPVNDVNINTSRGVVY